MTKDPVLYKRALAELRRQIEDALGQHQWRSQSGGAGQALVQLFGHFADVIISRLNRVPEQHLRAFLNEAEIDLLPARPANVELTFVPAADGAVAIDVPAGVQVATRPTDTQPEVIFETERDLVVIPTAVEKCIAVDALRWSDRTTAARGETNAPFLIFAGETERERVLYVGHDTLLAFPDVASRQNATITLHFTVERGADPAADGNWRLEWLYWDGQAWQDLKKAGANIDDRTQELRTSGRVIFSTLPELHKSTVDGEESIWLQCRLVDGAARAHLPKIADLHIARGIVIPPPTKATGAALLQSRLGQAGEDGKVREHLLYIGHQQLFSFSDPNARQRAVITLQPVFDRFGAAPDAWGGKLQWLYWNGAQWQDLEAAGARIVDETKQLTKAGSIRLTQLPGLMASAVNDVAAVWLAARLVAPPLNALDPATLPVLTGVMIECRIPAKTAVVDTLLAAVQAGTAYTPLEVKGPFLPLGPTPTALDTFYLQIDEAFTKPGATVTLTFALEGLPDDIEDTSELDRLLLEWEYFSNDARSDGWTLLGRSIRGCATLVAYDFVEVGLSDPVIRTNPLTRSKVIEFVAPPAFSTADLQGPRRDGQIITDIYTNVRYVQFPLPKECEQLPPAYLLTGCYKAERLNFRDRTCAFTAQGVATVRFDIPAPGDAPLFAQTEVDGRRGYWLRVRIAAGSYNVPQKADPSLLQRLTFQPGQFLPPKSYPPVVAQMEVTYTNYLVPEEVQRIQHCKSKTDALWRNYAVAPDEWQPFAPFTPPAHLQAEPALYIGFNPLDSTGARVAFPSNKWIQMRLDVVEKEQVSDSELLWQYWDGRTWSNLRMVDDTVGLQRSGYLNFFGPPDHQQSVEFGVAAYWLRVLPRNALPAARGTQATTSPTMPAPGIRLRTLLLNTVPATNGGLIVDELLGFSSGEPNQHFTLTHTPILPAIELEVREPEIHSEGLHMPPLVTAATPAAPATALASDQGVADHEEWVPWQPVASFYGCGPDSRCYLLDPIRGEIRFGDGKRGKIPPPGSNNIRIKRYRAHNAVAGNLASGALTVLRNPSGALSDIQSVTNLAPAIGGVDAEVVDQVIRRGPHTLKHRQQPVMAEDFQWITLEADNVARAYCLPTRDPQGAQQPGWVTVVVVPQSTETRPLPAPGMLRQIRNRLETLALANLKQFDFIDPGEPSAGSTKDVDQIHVIGPQYIEVQIRGAIVPLVPEKGDDVRLAVLQRLAEFMHPLSGGPERQGWEPGRDVHISEVAAEIESVPGVDHIESLTLAVAGIQQSDLVLAGNAQATAQMAAGSLVSTFDGRIKMVLAKTWAKDEMLQRLTVYGFKRGDAVTLLTTAGATLATDQTIARVEAVDHAVFFATPVPWSAIADQGQLFLKAPHTRLLIERYLRTVADEENAPVSGVVVRGVQPGDDGFAVGDAVSILTAEGLSLALDLVIAQIDPTHNLVCFAQAIPWPPTEARLILRSRQTNVPIKTSLLSRVKDAQGNPLLTGVVLRGYRPSEQPLTAGEQVSIINAAGAPVTGAQTVSTVERFDNVLYFAQGIPWEVACTLPIKELVLQGKQTRLLVEQGQLSADEQGQPLLVSVVVRGFQPGDLLSVIQRDQPRRRIDFLPIQAIVAIDRLTRIYVPDDHLVVSGLHEMKLAPRV